MTLEYRPSDPAVFADPFGVYRRLRDEDPAHWSPRLKAWVLTRYEDVKRVCLDTAGMSSDRLRPFFATLPSAEAARMGEDPHPHAVDGVSRSAGAHAPA